MLQNSKENHFTDRSAIRFRGKPFSCSDCRYKIQVIDHMHLNSEENHSHVLSAVKILVEVHVLLTSKKNYSIVQSGENSIKVL